MRLYFICPEKKKTFPCADYSLDPGYRILQEDIGHRTLQGTVRLTSDCPFCGKRHVFAAEEVLCPLSGEKNGS